MVTAVAMGRGEREDVEREGREQDHAERAPRAAEEIDVALSRDGGPRARAERLAGRQLEADPGEALVEVTRGDASSSGGRVDEEDLRRRVPLEDEEVVHLPVEDRRHVDGREVRRLEAPATGLQAVTPRRDHDVLRVGAVARHAAGLTKLGQRRVVPEVGQHHRQRGRAALDRLHLRDERDASPRQHRVHDIRAASSTQGRLRLRLRRRRPCSVERVLVDERAEPRERLCSCGRTELPAGAMQEHAHRRDRQAELVGDDFVRMPHVRLRQDLVFALAQVLAWRARRR